MELSHWDCRLALSTGYEFGPHLGTTVACIAAFRIGLKKVAPGRE
jgi:hypothetical protein